MEKALKYELGRCEMEALDKIAEDLEDAARRHNSKILYWHVNKLKGSSQSWLVPVKDRKGATISGKEKVKERWVEHFENVLNRDTVAGKDKDKNEKVRDTLDVKEDLFSEEELATVLKGLKIIRLHVLIVWLMSFLNMVALRLGISYWRLWTWFLKKGKNPMILGKP